MNSMSIYSELSCKFQSTSQWVSSRLKRITMSLTLVMLVTCSVLINLGGLVGVAQAYVAGDVIYLNVESSTYNPSSGTDFSITATLTDFFGNGVAGKAGDGKKNGIFIKKISDKSGKNATTTFPIKNGTVWSDNGDGTYTITGNITGTLAKSPYLIELEYKDPLNKKIKFKGAVTVTVGGSASSTVPALFDSAPDYTYYPWPDGTVVARVRLLNQDGSGHATATYKQTKPVPDSMRIKNIKDATGAKIGGFIIGGFYNYANGIYEIIIDYTGATDNTIYIAEVEYIWNADRKVKLKTSFAFEVNSTQAPDGPTGTPPSNPGCQACTPTLAVISDFNIYEESGRVVVQWETASEIGTVGFNLYRKINGTEEYQQVNKDLLVGLLHSPQGGTYHYVDEEAWPGETYTYKLVEMEASGNNRSYGPFTVAVNEQVINLSGGRALQSAPKPLDYAYSKKPHKVSVTKEARIQAGKASRKMVNTSRMTKVGNKAKIAVREDGLYYLDASKIDTVLGIPSRLGNHWMRKKNGFSLSNQGRGIAYLPAENDSGIYFYGQGIDSIYTMENIYWLKKGKGLEMKIVKGEGPDPTSGGETFTETIHLEEDHWALTALFDNPQADYWLWDYIVSGAPGMGSKTFNLWAAGVANTSDTATLTVYLQGATNTEANPDHHVVITLNGTEIGESYWEGTASHEVTLSFSQGLLNEGNNTVQVTGVLDTGAAYSIFYIDSFDLTYQRLYQASGNTLLCRGDTNPVVTISGFTDPEILLFEVTDPRRPKLIKSTTIDEMDGEYRISFRPTSSDSLYLALTANRVSAPLSFIADVPSQLKQRNNTADYLLITPAELKEAAQSLAAYRQGQGLKAMVVELEDIMDEFNYGIFSPEAIKDFLSYAYNNWKKAPRYVVLSGEGTYDYRNNQGFGDNLMPPLMVSTPHGLFASDNQFVDVAGNDGIPEMAIGRLPVLTEEELHWIIDKIVAYEGNSSGSWKRRVLMLADNPDEGGNFPADSDDVAALLPLEYSAEKIYLSEYSISEARQMLLDAINSGTVLLNYIGHAGLDRLASEGLLLASDVSSLANGERLPVVTAMTCVVGQFAIPGYDSLSEVLLLKTNGGAVAVWAPTGLSLNSQAKTMDKEFFRAVFEGREKILGEAVLRALEGYANKGGKAYLLNIYNLLGDPALRIR